MLFTNIRTSLSLILTLLLVGGLSVHADLRSDDGGRNAGSVPTAYSQDLVLDEDQSLVVTLSGSDPEGDQLTYHVVESPLYGVLSGSGDTLTYTPESDYYGVDFFRFTVQDGLGESQSAKVSLTVNPVRDTDCIDCDGGVFVNQDVLIDLNTAVPTISDVLAPYFHYDTSAADPGEWRAFLEIGNRKLMLYGGAVLEMAPITAPDGQTVTPSLEIRSQCEVYIGQGSGIRNIADRAGKLALQSGGDMRVEGFLRSESGNGPNGSIHVSTICGNLTTGDGSRIESIGVDGGGSNITLLTCGDGRLDSAGLVESRYSMADPFGAEINIIANDGVVGISGTHLHESSKDRLVYSGVRALSTGAAAPGRINVFAGLDVTIYGYGFSWGSAAAPFEAGRQEGTLAVKKGDTANKGGRISVTAKRGAILAFDHAIDNANPQNSLGEVNLEAAKDINLQGGTADAPANVINNSSLGGSHPSGGQTLLRSYANKIVVNHHAAVRSEGWNGGPSGDIHATACEGLFAFGVVSPTALEMNACGGNPAGIELVPAFVSSPTLEAEPDQEYQYLALANDPACRPLRYQLIEGPDGMTVNARTGLVSWTPSQAQSGSHEVEIEARTGCNAVSQHFTIEMEDDPCAEGPVITSDPILAVNEGAVYGYQPEAVDSSDDTLSWSLARAPEGMSIDPINGYLSWDPDLIYMESLIADNTTCSGYDLSVHSPTLTKSSDGVTVSAIIVNRGSAVVSQSIRVELMTRNESGSEISLGQLTVSGLDAFTDRAVDFQGLDVPTDDLFIRVVSEDPSADCIIDNTYVLAAMVSLQVSDSCDLLAEQHFLVRVINLNQAPAISSLSPVSVIAAGTPFSSDVFGSDGDRGDALVFSLAAAPGGMTIDPVSGSINWTPTEDQVGSHLATVVVTDLGGLSDQLVLDLEVYAANKRPLANDQSLTTSEATAVPFTLTGSDPDGDAIHFAVQSQPASGILAGAAPNLIYTPHAGFVGTDQVTFVVDDGALTSQPGVVTIVVTAVNNPPQAHDQTLTTPEETPVDVVLTGMDPEGGALTYRITQSPQFGELSGSGAAWTYTPVANYHGPDSFQFTVNDGVHDALPAVVTITVTPVGEAPVAEDINLVTEENIAVDFGLLGSDPDGDNLTHVVLTQPTNGVLAGVAPALTYQPNAAFSGVDSFTYLVNDGQANSNIATVTITVTDINRPPYFTSEPETNVVLESTTGQGDPIDLNNFTFMDLPIGSQGSANWVVQDDGYTVLQRVNSRASVFLSDFTLENDQIQGKWRVETRSDDDFIGFVFGWQDPTHFYLLDWKQNAQSSARRGLTVKKISTEPENLSRVQLWSTYNGFGVDTLYHDDANEVPWRDLTEYDFFLSFHPGEFTITVSEGDTVLKTITIEDDSYTSGRFGFFNYSQGYVRYSGFSRRVLSGNVFTYDVTTEDPDGDATTVTLLEAPENMTFDVATGALRWITAPSDTGTHPVRLRVEDPFGLFSEQSFEVVVLEINPVVTSKPRTNTFADRPYAYEVAASDPNPGDVLSFELTQAPVGMTVSGIGAIGWVPTEADLGDHMVTVRVSDQDGNFVDHSYSLTVNALPDNEPPFFTFQPPLTATVGRSYHAVPTAEDPDGDEVLISLVQAPYHMQLFDAVNLTWVPTADQVGDHEVILEVSDGIFGSQNMSFTISVSPLNGGNQAPVLSSQPGTLAIIDQFYTYQIQAVDPDDDTLSYFLDRGPAGMTIDQETGLITFTPGLDQLGEHRIQLRVSDGVGGVIPQNFNLYVATRADNERPVIVSEPERFAPPDALWSYQVTAVDPDGDELELSLVNGPDGMVMDGNGLIQWTPVSADFGGHAVAVRAVDEHLAGMEQHFTLLVSDAVNHNPEIQSSPALDVRAGELYRYQAIAVDVDGDLLTWSLATAPAGMRVNGVGLIEWPTSLDLTGSYNVTLVVRDGRGGTDHQSFVLTASPDDNSSPIITSQPTAHTVAPGEIWSYQMTAEEPDGDALSWSLQQAPAGMVIDQNGLVQWTPTQADLGDHELVLAVFDSLGFGVTQIFTLSVIDQPNHAPVITSAAVTIALEGSSYVYHVQAQDADFDSLIYTISVGPANMSIGPNGRITWTPDSAGSVAVTVAVSDGRGGEDTQSFTIVVEERLELPEDLLGSGFIWLAAQQDAAGAVSLSNLLTTDYQATAVAVQAFDAWTGTPSLDRSGAVAFMAQQNGLDTQHISLWTVVDGGVLSDGRNSITALRDAACPDGYGNNQGYEATSFDTIHALSALNALTGVPAQTHTEAINFLLDQQKSDGGWGLDTNNSDVDSTAAALIALAPHRSSSAVSVAMVAGQTWLLAQRQNQLWGEPFQSGLALAALYSHVPLAQLEPSVQALIADQDTDGSWGGDVYTTAVVLRALLLFDNPDSVGVSGGRGAQRAPSTQPGSRYAALGQSGSRKIIDLGYFHGGAQNRGLKPVRAEESVDSPATAASPYYGQDQPLHIEEPLVVDFGGMEPAYLGDPALEGMVRFNLEAKTPEMIFDLGGRDLVLGSGAEIIVIGESEGIVSFHNLKSLEITHQAQVTTQLVHALRFFVLGDVLVNGLLTHEGNGELSLQAGGGIHIAPYGVIELNARNMSRLRLGSVDDLVVDGLVWAQALQRGFVLIELHAAEGDLVINGSPWTGVALAGVGGSKHLISLRAGGAVEVNGGAAVRLETDLGLGGIRVQSQRGSTIIEDGAFSAESVQFVDVEN